MSDIYKLIMPGLSNPEQHYEEDLAQETEPKVDAFGNESLTTSERFKNAAKRMKDEWRRKNVGPQVENGTNTTAERSYDPKSVDNFFNGKGPIKAWNPQTNRYETAIDEPPETPISDSQPETEVLTTAHALNKEPSLRRLTTPITRHDQEIAKRRARGLGVPPTTNQSLVMSDEFKLSAQAQRHEWVAQANNAIKPKKPVRLTAHPVPEYDEDSLLRYFDDGTPPLVWNPETRTYDVLHEPIKYVEPKDEDGSTKPVTKDQAARVEKSLGIKGILDPDTHPGINTALRLGRVVAPTLATALAIGSGGIPKNIGPSVQQAVNSIVTPISESIGVSPLPTPQSTETREPQLDTEKENLPAPTINLRDIRVEDFTKGTEQSLKALVISLEELKDQGITMSDITSLKVQIEEVDDDETENIEIPNVVGIKHLGSSNNATRTAAQSLADNQLSPIEHLSELSSMFENQVDTVDPNGNNPLILFILPTPTDGGDELFKMKTHGSQIIGDQKTSTYYGVTEANSIVLNYLPKNSRLSLVITYKGQQSEFTPADEKSGGTGTQTKIIATTMNLTERDLLTSDQQRLKIST